MSYLLEILGSFVVGIFVILMMLEFNENINEQLIDRTYHLSTSYNAQTTAQIFEYDFYKIGYRDSSSNTIITADSTEIKYKSDVDNNGVVDSIRYYLGNSDVLTNSTNPNDLPIYRRVNNNSPELIGVLTELRLTYLNSSGAGFVPTNQAERNLIRALRLYVRMEADEPYDIISGDTIYRAQEFTRTFQIRN